MGAEAPERQRLKISLRGAVQGVGFRPFVYRLATELGLNGWVNNSTQGVFIEVEGGRPDLERFLSRLEPEKPQRSFIQSLESAWLDPLGYASFEVRASDPGGEKTALVLPDIATCPDCLREVFDPANRRCFYPFTNCTNCGPRFSIIQALPYDRTNTSMARFTMCPQCQAEYDNPLDRRFHAQPNACPNCGPHLELWDAKGQTQAAAGDSRSPLLAAVEALRQGAILAVKGLGGFHLMVAAHNDEAVRQLRERKHREEKPFALMFPSMEQIKPQCEVNEFEERLLRSPEAPIVLLHRKPQTPQSAIRNPPVLRSGTAEGGQSAISPLVAPANPNLGVMLPSNPLHHLLLAALGFPVVATSGNLSDEPICTDEREALEKLGGIADLFLVHNRPIVRHVDDSIARVMLGRELILRRARGYAPLPVQLIDGSDRGCPKPPQLGPSSSRGDNRNVAASTEAAAEDSRGPAHAQPAILAVGAHLKNSVALSVGLQVFLSQHIGDLETSQAFEAFRRVIRDFEHLYDRKPDAIAADLHPDYLSTKFARESGLPMVGVQHHLAHVLSCMAENELQPPVLGASWDGTGYGLDGTVWGGEFFLVTEGSFQRAGYFLPFRLPGGDTAVREPRRAALGALYEIFGEAAFDMKELASIQAFSPGELATLKTMLQRQLNAPLTSSVGRLFDAVASLLGLRQRVRFEGQAAMELEFAIQDFETDQCYGFELRICPVLAGVPPSQVVDWSLLLKGILRDLSLRTPVGAIAAKFHNTLVEVIVAMARQLAEPKVVLTGGCFQNRYLTEQAVHRLRRAGFRPYWHQRIPPNDGGIALGQIVAARRPIQYRS